MGILERQKIEERIDFTDAEKYQIGKKTDGVCAHCGKKIHWAINATVDHYVPLNQGGTNRKFNLIPLCKTCNDEKSDKIYDPESYIHYLKDEPLKELNDYFQSYIHSFNFFQRRNLLACDMYELKFAPIYYAFSTGKYKNKNKIAAIKIHIKRARAEDLDRITEYMKSYFKKVDCLDDEASVRHNVEFWFNFSAIYYVERDGEIANVCVICLTKHDDEYSEDDKIKINHSVSIIIMPKYNNLLAYNIAMTLATDLPGKIMEEQGIEYLPVRIMSLGTENFIGRLSRALGYPSTPWRRFFQIRFIKVNDSFDPSNSENSNSVVESYLANFDAIESEIDEYIKSTGHHDIEWMKILIDKSLDTEDQ